MTDKRIQQLLAVIEAKDALMSQCVESNLHLADGDICTLKLIKEAIAIKPENVELVEVGGFVMHEDKHGTRYPSSQMSYNYDEFQIGALNKLYTIKTKE